MRRLFEISIGQVADRLRRGAEQARPGIFGPLFGLHWHRSQGMETACTVGDRVDGHRKEGRSLVAGEHVATRERVISNEVANHLHGRDAPSELPLQPAAYEEAVIPTTCGSPPIGLRPTRVCTADQSLPRVHRCPDCSRRWRPRTQAASGPAMDAGTQNPAPRVRAAHDEPRRDRCASACDRGPTLARSRHPEVNAP